MPLQYPLSSSVKTESFIKSVVSSKDSFDDEKDKAPSKDAVKKYIEFIKNNIVTEFMNTSYGVAWNEETDTYYRLGTIASLPVSHKPNDSLLTVHSKIRRCILKDDGIVNYYLHPVNSLLKEDGVTPSVLNGKDGQVMVEIPKFWYKYSYSFGTHSWKISPHMLEGFSVHPAFMQGNAEKNYLYVGAYEGVLWDATISQNVDGCSTQAPWKAQDVDQKNDKLSSISGKLPITDHPREVLRKIASNRGSGWTLETIGMNSVIQLLFLIEYASFNSQKLLGSGVTSTSDWHTKSFFPFLRTGNSNTVGNKTQNKSGNKLMKEEENSFISYRGIENVFGHIEKMLDGIIIRKNKIYINNVPSTFEEGLNINYYDLNISLPVMEGYQKSLIPSLFGFIPHSVEASSSTHVTDYTLIKDRESTILTVGGKANSTQEAGLFNYTVYLKNGEKAPFVGSRLCFI